MILNVLLVADLIKLTTYISRMNKLQKGFSMVELLVVVVIAGILALFGSMMYGSDIDCDDARPGPLARARIANAIGSIGAVHIQVQRFELTYNRLPTSLAELNMADATDPWGNDYQFLDHATVNGNGPKRKDHNMVPVNRGYDIYSMGPDGKTATPFTSILGQDDIVMAGNGAYFGIACKYYTK